MVLVSKSKLGYALFKIKERLKIKLQAFVLVFIKHWAFFWRHPVDFEADLFSGHIFSIVIKELYPIMKNIKRCQSIKVPSSTWPAVHVY